MRNTLLRRCLSSISLFCSLSFVSVGQEYLKQDLTGYNSVLGELYYGSEEDDIDYFLKTENNLWLYSLKSGLLRVLDYSNVEVGQQKIRFRYETNDNRIRLLDRVNFFIVGKDSIAFELNRDSKRSTVVYFTMSGGKLKSDKETLDQNILHSRSYPLKSNSSLHAKEVDHNDFYLLHIDPNQDTDTLFTSIKNSISTVYSLSPNIVLQKGHSGRFYLLDKFTHTLYQYNASERKLEILLSRNELREVFAWTKSFMTFEVEMLFDEAQKKLYLLSKKVINGDSKSVLYFWTGSEFEEIEVPNYKPELDKYFNVQQIFNGNIYFTKSGFFGVQNKYIHKVKLN